MRLDHAPSGVAYLRSRLGVGELAAPFRSKIDEVTIPPSRAWPELLEALANIVGGQHVLHDHAERVLHSAGKSYRDLLRLRQFRLEQATDVVVYPGNEDQLAGVLALCRQERVAVIPFGGGTSVVSGLEPDPAGLRAVVTLDLCRLQRVLQIDPISQTATVEAGIFGPDLEQHLRAKGYLLGHFPQSFEFSTLGGWLATRSSGQNCLGYGGIDRLVESLRVVTPVGTVETLRVPRRGDGPDLTQVLVGGEGTLGVIVSATVRIRPAPADQDYFMVAFPSYRAGNEACRTLLQKSGRGLSPALLRVSDEAETEGTLAMGQSSAQGLAAWKRRAAKWVLKRRGLLPPHLATVLVGLEGPPRENRRQRKKILRHFADQGGFSLGSSPGRRWLEGRFELPYLRDELLDNHLLIDTLETCTTWARLDELYETVRRALADEAARQGEPLLVYCHTSHLYPDGASLYFTLLGRQKVADPLGQWQSLKTAANQAIRDHGAVISHHHGVGLDHRGHTGRSEPEWAMLRGLKQSLDPDGIMNPGKLL